MSLRERIGDAIAGRGRKSEKNQVRQRSSHQYHVSSLCSAYENLFAQVRPLINDMKAVFPYGVGSNGARLPMTRTPELSVLADPNTTMGWAEFADAMFATWLTEDELNVWVHFDERGRNVIGYTILPVGERETRVDGSYVWHHREDGVTYELTEDNVATLRFSRNPRDLEKGVSPASSIFTWSQIDDLVSQYQKAFFENGAVPATITFIKAKSREAYEDKREKLEHGLRGARNRNKTVYIWRQTLDDGQQADEMEVKTIQGNNATLAIKDIIEIINDKLNKAIGVSNFILGDDSSAKYDNAELSDYQFIKRRVYPALMSFWGQFQHELDRITGGLGYAIQFELELPELTERLKVKAETTKIRTETLKALIEAGSGPYAAVKALDMSEKWQAVADGIYREQLRLREIEDKESTVYSIQVSQSESKADSAQEAVVVEDSAKSAPERKLEANNSDSDYGYAPVFGEGEERAKEIYDALVDYAQKILEEEPNISPEELVERLNEILMQDVENGAGESVEAVKGLLYGKDGYEEVFKALENDGYKLSDEFKEQMKARTAELVQSFGDTTKEIGKKTLEKAAAEGWSASQLKKELVAAIPKSRAELIARNETVYAVKAGRIETDKYIEKNYGVQINLVWRISDDSACDVCKAMNGTKVKCGEAFPDHEEYEGVAHYWEHSSWNDNGQTPSAHPNCRCYFDEEIV